MKILKSAPFLLFSAVFAAGLSLPAAADDTGEVKIISRQIERNLERVTPRSQGTRAVFNNNFQPRTKTKSNRKFNEGPIFGDNDCTRRTCGGAMFGPQTCKRIKLPCEDCGDQPKPVKPRPHIKNYVTLEEDIFQTIHHRCGDFAPLQLEWVDFRIKKGRDRTYSRRLGNYRFRIFGCRRDQRHAVLNEGRIIQKDMEFIRIFEDKVSDCYNIVKIPNDVCLSGVNKPLPEYVLTAEITDYFMNLCDEYDWKDAEKANLRTGSAQMTVTWRLMDLSKSNVLWKGESNGYSEVPDGEYNAEMILIERAFADAVDNLRQLPGFEDQLAVRQTPEDLEAQKQALIAMERMNDPVKCQYQPEIKQAQTLCPLQENGGTAADGQMCTAQTEPELLSICPADNPDCSGSIEELGGSAGNGQYAQDNQTLILDQPAQDYSDTEVAVAEVTPVEESGDTIDMGGSLNAREAEIADAAAKAETVRFSLTNSATRLNSAAERKTAEHPPISARLTPTATRSAANRLPSKKEITKKNMPVKTETSANPPCLNFCMRKTAAAPRRRYRSFTKKTAAVNRQSLMTCSEPNLPALLKKNRRLWLKTLSNSLTASRNPTFILKKAAISRKAAISLKKTAASLTSAVQSKPTDNLGLRLICRRKKPRI